MSADRLHPVGPRLLACQLSSRRRRADSAATISLAIDKRSQTKLVCQAPVKEPRTRRRHIFLYSATFEPSAYQMDRLTQTEGKENIYTTYIYISSTLSLSRARKPFEQPAAGLAG